MSREEQMMAEADAYAAGAYADEPVCFSTEEAICETINDFVAGWRAADSHPQWMPVEEELPKKKGKYMFRLSNGDMCYETYYPELKLVANVTHWMPIVPPRKEDKK